MLTNISVAVPSPVCLQESESGKYTASSESTNTDVLLLNNASISATSVSFVKGDLFTDTLKF
jgi:hypothetical protein